MNRFIYIDNFRGFSNTYIPLVDVNFLVGENSTGKTSVLSLLHMITSQGFLYDTEFGARHIKSIFFSDAVSAQAEDRAYFTVGLGWKDANLSSKAVVPAAFLATYASSPEGLPYIKKFTFQRGDFKIILHMSNHNGGPVHFRQERESPPNNLQGFQDSVFPEWIQEHSEDFKEERFTDFEIPQHTKIPLFVLMSLAYQRMSGDKEEKQHLPFFAWKPISKNTVWIAPIRTTPRRIYDEPQPDYSPEGAHTPYILRKILSPKKKSDVAKSLKSIGRSSGLFKSISIKNHGTEMTAPFEVDIVLDKEPLNLCTVGYGVSQSLPVLVEILNRPEGAWFSIQQPEVHLHPRAQASLGDTLFRLAIGDRKRFLVETHSDFMIDRFRMNYKNASGEKPSSQILFFERKGSKNVAIPIAIDEKGELPTDQPDTYRKFFFNEGLRLLGIN